MHIYIAAYNIDLNNFYGTICMSISDYAKLYWQFLLNGCSNRETLRLSCVHWQERKGKDILKLIC